GPGAAAVEPRAHHVAEGAHGPRAPARVLELPLGLQFAAVEARVGLDPGAHGQAVLDDPRVGQVDEVGVAQVVEGRAQAQRADVPVQAQLGTIRGFHPQRGVAELPAARGHVQAARVELFGGGRALRAVQPEQQVQAGRQVPARRQRRAGGVEAPAAGAAPGFDPVAVMAQAELEAERAEVALADPERAQVARLGVRDEGFLAGGREIAPRSLQAEGALPARQRLVYQFHAALDRVVVEDRADLAALVLGVRVRGVRQAHAQAAHRAAAVEAAADFGPALVQV